MCPNNARPFLHTSPPQYLQDFTYYIPNKHELWEILEDMRKNASPGPDGFNVGFYTLAWEWIGDDVTTLVRYFYNTGILPPRINETQIALIPKKIGLPCVC